MDAPAIQPTFVGNVNVESNTSFLPPHDNYEYPAPKDMDGLLLERDNLKDVERRLLSDLHGKQTQIVHLTHRRRDDIFQSLDLIEALVNSVKCDAGTELLRGVREAVDGVTNTLERNSTHIQLAFNQYKSTMERLLSVSRTLSYREQSETACKATKSIMDDCEARLIQASNIYSTLLSEKDSVLEQTRLQCQGLKAQADFSFGAKLAFKEQLRNLQATMERESYLKNLAVKESLELRARLNDSIKPDNQATRSVSEGSSVNTTLCSSVSETGVTLPDPTQKQTDASDANAIPRKEIIMEAKITTMEAEITTMKAKITSMTAEAKTAAANRATAEGNLSAASTQIKQLRAQLAAEVASARESRAVAHKGTMTSQNAANDPFLSVRAIEGWAASQEVLAARVAELKEKLAAPPLIDVVEYSRLTPPPREQQEQQQSQPAPAATADGAGDASSAPAAVDLAAVDLAAVRAAAAAGDEPAFKTEFWRVLRALDRAGRAAERDACALLPGGRSGGNREARRPLVKDLISIRDEPPEEWRWSPKSSVDLGSLEKACEAAAVQTGSGDAQKENELPPKPVASSDEVLELLAEKGESVTPLKMLTTIEERLKSVGLHKDSPERAYVCRDLDSAKEIRRRGGRR